MSDFKCSVVKIDNKSNHPNADRLTIYNIGGYTLVSAKLPNGQDRYEVGDWVVYIPEGSLVPQWLLKELGLWDDDKQKGILGGSKGDRVVPVKLRGVVSEGLMYSCVSEKEDPDFGGSWFMCNDPDKEVRHLYVNGLLETVQLGQDVSDLLGVQKWVPCVPTKLQGEVFSSTSSKIVKYDIEPIQKYPDVLQEGETVRFTEKLHGTQTRIGFYHTPVDDQAFGANHNILISSKGLGDKGLYFKNNDVNANNCYITAFKQFDLERKVMNSSLFNNNEIVIVFGETVGVQDLKYGLNAGQVGFRMFDVWVGDQKQGKFLDTKQLDQFAAETSIDLVPTLYEGRFSRAAVDEFTRGTTRYGSDRKQIREGIVIRPTVEREHDSLGRVVLKSVSNDYKFRKGNATEFN